MRAVRGWEGSGEPRGGFHYANRRAGFISACAPRLQGWEGMPGFRGQPNAGRHRCQLSFLFLIHSERGHTVPPPPGQRNVLFCTALLAAPRPSVEIPQALNGQSATGAGEALLEQANTLSPEPPSGGACPTQNWRGNSQRKKDSTRVIYPNRERQSHPLKNPGQASSWSVGHPDTTVLRLRTGPNTTRGGTPRHVAVLEACASVWVGGTQLSLRPRGN